MPNLTLNFRPDSLGAGTPVNIYLPDEITDDMPVLYLLHGMHGDHMSWLNGSAIGRYARALKIAVIMPSVGNSFYCNMKYGGRYHDYVAIELPEYIGKASPHKAAVSVICAIFPLASFNPAALGSADISKAVSGIIFTPVLDGTLYRITGILTLFAIALKCSTTPF